MEYPELYVRFLYHFNVDRDYYECHEVMEELWLEEGRYKLYQGLLQVAVGLYHHQNNNISGSIKLFEAGVTKLEGYPDDALGINLRKIKNNARQYLNKLYRYQESPFSCYHLDIEILDPNLKEQVERMQQAERMENEMETD